MRKTWPRSRMTIQIKNRYNVAVSMTPSESPKKRDDAFWEKAAFWMSCAGWTFVVGGVSVAPTRLVIFETAAHAFVEKLAITTKKVKRDRRPIAVHALRGGEAKKTRRPLRLFFCFCDKRNPKKI